MAFKVASRVRGLSDEAFREAFGTEDQCRSTLIWLRKVKLTPVRDFRRREIARGVKRWQAPGAEVVTDGLRCWNVLAEAEFGHRTIPTGSGRKAARMAPSRGQYHAWQHQERDHRNLSQARP